VVESALVQTQVSVVVALTNSLFLNIAK
jgi:hypothetical protein